MTRSRRKQSRALCFLSISYFIFIILLCVAESFIAEKYWFTTILTYAPQHPFGIPLILLVPWALLHKQWRMLALNLASTLMFLFVLMGVSVHFPITSPSTSNLRIMTYNIHCGTRGISGIAEVVKSAKPDILCLQESIALGRNPDPVENLRKYLKGWDMIRAGDIAILSRFPIESRKVYIMPVTVRRAILKAVINVNGHRVSVFNVHFATAMKPHSLMRRKNMLPEYIAETARARSIQAWYLLDWVGKTSSPVIIAGDFNTPPRGRIYRRIEHSYRSAFALAGWGTGCTFRSDMPLLRIDHIFVGNRLSVIDCKALKTQASDHRPLIARVVFEDNMGTSR